MRIREADGPALELELAEPDVRSVPLPLAGAGKRTRDGARSKTGELEGLLLEREVSSPLEGTALRVGDGLALELLVRRGAGAL